MLVDEVEIEVVAGRGGDGVTSFRREKFEPRGGPDGGNGGAGGSVCFEASSNQNTLAAFRYRPKYRAPRGRNGEGGRRNGRAGEALVIHVPVGTLIWDTPSGERLGDLKSKGDRLIAARGGRGGRGNAVFATSTNQAPRRSELGEAGEARHIRLELRLLADVGLVGFPNAGKSTFISRVSSARPKIADYPFTTLTPHLGVVEFGDADDVASFVIADVPGLIPGASKGAGLGHQFLKHLTRTALLVYFVDVSEASGREPSSDLETLRKEVSAFGQGLEAKPAAVAANKVDAMNDTGRLRSLEEAARRVGLTCWPVSAVIGEGCHEIVGALSRRLAEDAVEREA